MEIKTASIEELEARKAQIGVDADAEGADMDALEAEVRAINTEIEARQADEAKRVEIRKLVANGAGKVSKTFKAKEKKSPDEIRSSKEYMTAYVKFLKTQDDTECRMLLTENATDGTVPVPSLVDSFIRTAWENDELLSRCKKTYVRGNLKVPFEVAGDDAYVHPEGGAAITDEDLSIGFATLIPEMVMKTVPFSVETENMNDEAFLRYIFDEVVYRITKKVAKRCIADIVESPSVSTTSAPAVAAIAEAPSVTTIENAAAQLSGEASNIAVLMNRQTRANFIAAQAAGNFSFDPFAGLPVIYGELPAYNLAEEGEAYAIVGDFGGQQLNYPNGEDVELIYDNITEAKKGTVNVTGRQYVGHGVTAPKRFCVIKKPTSTVTT